MSTNKIALILLTRNELPCLKVVFPTIPKPSPEAGFDEIYAVDGGSTDGTVEFFKEHGVPVISQSKRGRGEAFLQAFETIKADAFVFFSPDGNEDIRDLPKFKERLNQGADVVIASRMMKGAWNEEDHLTFKWRKWANNAFNIMANMFFRKTKPFITDSINGYRAISKKAADVLKLDAYDYTIEYQMTIRAFKNKLNIVEFPTHEGERVAGETGAPSFQTGIKFIKRFFTELFAH
ncbi:MAG: glycosyltransferase family 2 protein [Bdellovibrionaceae bacterium]|nr:glycosyltransferase family 2 protein [Pseudobdellovibrionaceae bacterium]